MRLDAPWPLLKVAQQAQPHRLTYYPEARLYALTVTRQVRQPDGGQLCDQLSLFDPVAWLTAALWAHVSNP